MYFFLDERCQQILKNIMYAGGYRKIQEIADEMQVSKRSIYYDLNKINEWLESLGIDPLISERSKGIYASSEQITKIQQALDETDNAEYVAYTPVERNQIQICSIIIRSHPLYIENFMELCDVSRNTIINDLKGVTDFLGHYNLKLTYDIKHGYRIEGDTIKKRAVFFMLFPLAWNSNQVKKIFSNDKISNIYKILKEIEKKLNVEYTNGMLHSLAVFLSSIEYRQDSLEFHAMDDMDKEEIKSTKEYDLVTHYFSSLKDEEKIYVSLHLLGSHLQSIPINVMNKQDETYEYAKTLVENFENTSCIYFDKKEELIQAINAHLKLSLYRYRYGIQLGNPLLDSIKTEYRDLFDLTQKACGYLEEKLECYISEAEVAYLTLHFGSFIEPFNKSGKQRDLKIAIICPNGIGTGNMLHSEVAALLPKSSEIVNIPLSKYTENHSYDVVISTVVIPKEKKIIVVHPILTDQDRVTILRNCMSIESKGKIEIQDIVKIASKFIPKKHLNEFNQELENYCSEVQVNMIPHLNFGRRLINYLLPSHIQIFDQEISWEESIRKSCEPLIYDGSIEEEYIEAILENQKERGQAMFLTNGLVLAHAAIEKGVNYLDVSMGIFKEPVEFWNGEKATIIIALCAEDQTKHIRLLKDILNIFSKKKSQDQILALDTPEEVFQFLLSHHNDDIEVQE